MDIRHLQYFATCVEAGSMSKAAEILYTSQPSVSHAINALEQELNTCLFFRGGRGLRLTESGRQFYEQTLNVLKAVNVMTSMAGSGSTSAFSLVTNPSGRMAALFADFCRDKLPDQSYRYYEASGEDVLQRVASSEADIGFLFVAKNKQASFSYALSRRHLTFTKLLSTDMVICAGPKNPFYNAPYVTAENLTTLSFVQPADDYFSLNDVITLPPSDGRNAVLRCVVRTNSDRAMLRLLSTTALCNLSSFWLRKDSAKSDLRLIPVSGYERTIAFGYVTTKLEPLREPVQTFIDYIRQALENEREEELSKL